MTESAGDVGVAETRARRRALGLLAPALVLSMSTWFSASAVLPQLESLWGLTSPGRAWLTVAVQMGFVVGALVLDRNHLARPGVSPTCHPGVVSGSGRGQPWAAGRRRSMARHIAPPPHRLLSGRCLSTGTQAYGDLVQADRGLALGLILGALTLGWPFLT